MFRQLQRRWQPRSLQQRFQRHCQELFPFHQHLSAAELSYLRACCFGDVDDAVASTRLWRSVFAHQVYEERVDSSAVAPRLTMHSDEAWEIALSSMPALKRTYVLATLQELDALGCVWRFDGLGWHVTEAVAFVHLYIPALERLSHTPWHELWKRLSTHHPLRPDGVISMRLQAHRIVGYDLIGYPPDEPGDGERPDVQTPEPHRHGTGLSQPLAVVLRSQKRQSSTDIEEVRVYAAAAAPRLSGRLNHLGRHLLGRYERWGERLEAFVYQSSHDCALFFP